MSGIPSCQERFRIDGWASEAQRCGRPRRDSRCSSRRPGRNFSAPLQARPLIPEPRPDHTARRACLKVSDRKSTRLNSSHSQISYAVFCLKKKKNLPMKPEKHAAELQSQTHDGERLPLAEKINRDLQQGIDTHAETPTHLSIARDHDTIRN